MSWSQCIHDNRCFFCSRYGSTGGASFDDDDDDDDDDASDARARRAERRDPLPRARAAAAKTQDTAARGIAAPSEVTIK